MLAISVGLWKSTCRYVKYSSTSLFMYTDTCRLNFDESKQKI